MAAMAFWLVVMSQQNKEWSSIKLATVRLFTSRLTAIEIHRATVWLKASTEVVIDHHVGGLRIAITQVGLHVVVLFVDPAGVHAVPDPARSPRQTVGATVWTQTGQLQKQGL